MLSNILKARAASTPSPVTPGEGWGGGLGVLASFAETPTLTLPRSTGGGKWFSALLALLIFSFACGRAAMAANAPIADAAERGD